MTCRKVSSINGSSPEVGSSSSSSSASEAIAATNGRVLVDVMDFIMRDTHGVVGRLRPAAYDDDPTLLTSEHIYPWMFDEMAALQPFRDAAHLLADRAWGPLYDPEALAANEVPTAAAVYADDMYVPRVFSEETAGRIRGLRMWLTNEYEHDGLAHPRVLERLIALARGMA